MFTVRTAVESFTVDYYIILIFGRRKHTGNRYELVSHIRKYPRRLIFGSFFLSVILQYACLNYFPLPIILLSIYYTNIINSNIVIIVEALSIVRYARTKKSSCSSNNPECRTRSTTHTSELGVPKPYFFQI